MQKTITIDAPVEEVFAFWTRYENFPRFMAHVREVRPTGAGRSHWVVAGPAGVPLEWDTERTAPCGCQSRSSLRAHLLARHRTGDRPGVLRVEVLQGILLEEHTTVGYEICVRHLRPTPVGESFTAAAELIEVDSRKLLFTVEARNARERIGDGTLRRTIVRRGRLG